MKPLIIALIFLGAVSVLVVSGIRANSIPKIKFSELVASGNQYEDTVVLIDDALIHSIQSLFPLKFAVAPKDYSGPPMQVQSDISPPENFKKEGSVAIRGRYDPQSALFTATMITTKCPSRYNADPDAELEKIVEKNKAALQAGVGAPDVD